MPFVKVPGFEREVWVDLHEPTDTGTPWFVSEGHEANLTPEQFASAMASGEFEHTATVVEIERSTREGQQLGIGSANAYEQARRKLAGGRTGSPRQSTGFSKWEDFAIIVLYFESLGHKQAIRHALAYWPEVQKLTIGQTVRLPRRHLEAALRRVRNWYIRDLFVAAELARKRWDLPPIPTKPPKRRKMHLN